MKASPGPNDIRHARRREREDRESKGTLMRSDVNVNVIRPTRGGRWDGRASPAARLMKTCVFNSVSTGLNVIGIL